MRITVLGKSPAWQDAGGACSGYLVEQDGSTLLVDCGNGVFSKLRERRDYFDVDAIVISHMHADHFFDLIPYAYALLFSPRAPIGGYPGPIDPKAMTEGRDRPKLFAPRGAHDTLTDICRDFSDPNLPLIDSAFEFHEYDPNETLEVGPMRVNFAEVPHWVLTYAIQVSADGGTFTYSADCAPSSALIEFARDTELMFVESTVTEPERYEPRGHLCPAEAGEHAAAANARRLVLTHISDERDYDKALADAGAHYRGDISVAAEGDVFEI